MNSIQVSAAGEHFVSYKLSAKGYPVGLTRGGSQSIDLMVGDIGGNKVVSVQVKTSSSAWREYKKKPENNHWEWPVGPKVTTLAGDSLFYAFVDLKSGDGMPDVFIVPSADIAQRFTAGDWKMETVWLMPAEKSEYFEAWYLIEARLNGKAKKLTQ